MTVDAMSLTVTTLSDIDTAHRYEGDELSRVFSVDAGE